MRRVWAALLLLALLLTGTLFHSRYLSTLTGGVSRQLTQATAAARAGDWDRAAALTAAARSRWEDRSFYLYAMLRHGSLDAIELEFIQAGLCLDRAAVHDFAAAAARLTAQLRLLSEAEQLTGQNVL